MTIIEVLLLLLIAGVCGSIAQSLAGYSSSGCLASIVLGFIGALLGSRLARLADLPLLFSINIGGQEFPIIWSIIGAAIFSAVLGLLSRRRPVV
ncbi:MAG: hypothetical protein WD065_13990 [Planctomycetaceae bacterium]